MLKAYLQELNEEAAVETLSRIVNPGADGINTEELVVLIDNARVVAAISADSWQAQEGEVLLKNTIEYMSAYLQTLRAEVVPEELNRVRQLGNTGTGGGHRSKRRGLAAESGATN